MTSPTVLLTAVPTAVDDLRTFAFVGVPVGLILGLALGVVANRADGWGGYASFRRRAARLGHVAAVMLPVIAGVYSLLLGDAQDSSLLLAGARLWWGGAVLLVAVLFATAWRPAFRFALPVPALALVAAGVLFWVAPAVAP